VHIPQQRLLARGEARRRLAVRGAIRAQPTVAGEEGKEANVIMVSGRHGGHAVVPRWGSWTGSPGQVIGPLPPGRQNGMPVERGGFSPRAARTPTKGGRSSQAATSGVCRLPARPIQRWETAGPADQQAPHRPFLLNEDLARRGARTEPS